MLLGHRTVCAVEIEPYCRKVLLQRQRDGILPWFPIWDDVRTFDGKPWRGIADVVCGGFPCQDISCAGSGKGIEGEKSGLWGEMARIIWEVRPRFVFVENSPMLTVRGIGTVLGQLAEMGFDARWGVLGAGDIGANHGRRRIWILADSDKKLVRWKGRRIRSVKKTHRHLWHTGKSKEFMEKPESVICGNGDDVAARMDRIAALGNGQVPVVAASAWRILMDT